MIVAVDLADQGAHQVLGAGEVYRSAMLVS